MRRWQIDAWLKEAAEKGYTVKWARYWDMASTKEAGDFTSGALCFWIKETDRFFIMNIKRGQWSPGKAEAMFTRYTKLDYNNHAPYQVGMEREPGSSGVYSIRHFQRLLKEGEDGISVALKEFPATQSKMLNAQPFTAAAENGKVYILDDAEADPHYRSEDGGKGWVGDFFDELEDFPEGAHDDMIDSVTGAYKLLTGKKGISATIGRGKDGITPESAGKVAKTGINHLNRAENGQIRRSSVTFGRKW